MTRAWFLLVLLAVATGPVAVAQGPSEPAAEARFHDGARLFADGDVSGAASVVDAALAESPRDARLRALRELIRQEQSPDGGGGDEPPDDAEDGNTGQAPPSEGDNPAEGPQSGEPPTDPSDGASPDGGAPGEAPPPEGRGPMSRAEAEALLDAVGGDERLLLRQQRRPSGSSARPERDW